MRNNRSIPDRKFHAENGEGMNSTYNDVVLGFIRREFAPLRHAAELLARAAGTTPRTAKNWLAGEHAPNGEKLLNLLAECKPLADEIFRVVEERRAARGGQ
jgi:hypothetical protein